MKRNWNKKGFVYVLLFSLVATFFLSGKAQEVEAKNKLGILKHVQHGNQFEISFAGVKEPKEKDTKIIIGNQEFKVDKIVNSSDYNEGNSYIFLLDVSGSISGNQYAFMESVMKGIIKEKKTEKIKIIIVGDKVKVFDTVSGSKDAMEEKLDSIVKKIPEVGTGATSLYEGIVKALEVAEEDKGLTMVRSVVVFSDGFETKDNSITQNEVMDVVKERRIPLFTVPVEEGVMSGVGEDTNEILSSFARRSIGGAALPFENRTNKEGVIKKILQSVKEINIATIDIRKLKAGKDTRDLKLEYKGETDRISLDMAKVKIKSSNEETTPSEETTVTEEAEVAEKKGNNNLLLYVGGGVAVLLVLLVGVLLMMKSGKVTVIFDMGSSIVKKPLKDKMIIGRDASKADYAMPNDSRLSSMHCMIYKEKKSLYIKDLDSTNGTFVNGKRIKGTGLLTKGDVLLVGSVEMKISWE